MLHRVGAAGPARDPEEDVRRVGYPPYQQGALAVTAVTAVTTATAALATIAVVSGAPDQPDQLSGGHADMPLVAPASTEISNMYGLSHTPLTTAPARPTDGRGVDGRPGLRDAATGAAGRSLRLHSGRVTANM